MNGGTKTLGRVCEGFETSYESTDLLIVYILLKIPILDSTFVFEKSEVDVQSKKIHVFTDRRLRVYSLLSDRLW